MQRLIHKALIIGSAGQVGGALIERLGPQRTTQTCYHTPVDNAIPFDLERAAQNNGIAEVLMAQSKPDVVIIAAAFSWVDGCESNPARAWATNRDGPAAVARAAQATGANVVYYSTEYIFDGENGPYAEDAPPNPLSVYARSKWEGEQAVREAHPDALILRTTVVFGPECQGKNFCYHLAEHIVAKGEIRAPSDQYSSPTYNRDLAEATVRLLESGASGVFHVVGPEVMDRVTFARRVARAAALNEDLIIPITTDALGQQATRPLRAGLTIGKLQRRLPGFHPRSVEESVRHWLEHPRGKPWPK